MILNNLNDYPALFVVNSGGRHHEYVVGPLIYKEIEAISVTYPIVSAKLIDSKGEPVSDLDVPSNACVSFLADFKTGEGTLFVSSPS